MRAQCQKIDVTDCSVSEAKRSVWRTTISSRRLMLRRTGTAAVTMILAVVVQNRVEESLALDAEDCGCGFEAGTACDLLSQQWYAFCRGRLDAETKAWMGRLPRQIEVRMAGRRLLAGSFDRRHAQCLSLRRQ